ncbi:transcription termination factor [Campylobacter iguaniorum]|uniref:Transcription termination/antitermination protein NusA n=1 Tax=Campylobacter iguaniorum TaxID=1244531 RepID=A0A076FB27_9BACT|nr:transcription termination factor NusA [Campylobacter iguaniorum]AII15211.1 transcription termination factor [Campylobacter iguaniorum]ALV25136.1 transcription termination factor [Campylobacter iguaniorum]
MEKISDIIESIANEKGLAYDDVKERICRAFVNAAKRLYGFECEYEATLDQATKNIHLYQKILVVDEDDERLDEEHFISLEKAHEVDKSLEIGDSLNYELNIDELGRTAAGALSREIDYHIQRLIEEKIHEKYSSKVNTLVFGTVVRVDSEENTFIEIDELRAVMSMKNRIKNEKFVVGNVVKAVIKSVRLDKKDGIKVELSRTSPKFLEALLKAEVPEIKDGGVIIQNSARIPGRKAKVALFSTTPNIDAVGATVGIKGVRINAVSNELNGENIDAIEYSSEPAIFVARALAPAIVSSVKIDDKKAIVSLVPEQKSKAIGASGINIRLASMLTGYEIELHEVGSAQKEINNEEGLKNLKALFGE